MIKKPILILTILLTLFFILVWLADTVFTSFNPNYQPLMDFLKVTSSLLQVTSGL